METEFTRCKKVLHNVVLESFKDAIHHLDKDPEVEGVQLIPISDEDEFSQTTLSFIRKGAADDSSVTFACTSAGTVIVAFFIAGAVVNGPKAPNELTRKWVDETVGAFVAKVLNSPVE